MSSLTEFMVAVLVVITGSFIYLYVKVDNLKEWATSRTGKGILKGIVLATVFCVGMAAIGMANAGTMFNDASVYFGLDHTKKLSPMCENEGPDSRTTSNIGLKLNIYRSDDQRFSVGSKYTHHSCAFSPDAKSYDALGFIVEYKFWQR